MQEEYPIYAQINGNIYALNTSYKVAIDCIDVINSSEYSDEERALLVIALLYKEWEEIPERDYKKACDIAVKYLLCGKEEIKEHNQEKDMDYKYDMEYIKASFMSDYKINIDKNPNMHWYKFHNYCNGLTEKCILNRVRDIRTYDLKDVKDKKQKEKIEKMQEVFALPKVLTSEELERIRKYNEIFGIKE